MIRKDKEISDRKLIYSILKKTEIIRISIFDEKYPYIVPMNFGFDGEVIYLHSAKKGKKNNLLKLNNNISFETDTNTHIVENENPCNWGMKFESVIGNGRAFFINDKHRKIKALNVIMQKYSGISNYDFNDKMLESVEVIEIKIDEIFGKSSYLK